jgi:hypothetical protein
MLDHCSAATQTIIIESMFSGTIQQIVVDRNRIVGGTMPLHGATSVHVLEMVVGNFNCVALVVELHAMIQIARMPFQQSSRPCLIRYFYQMIRDFRVLDNEFDDLEYRTMTLDAMNGRVILN